MNFKLFGIAATALITAISAHAQQDVLANEFAQAKALYAHRDSVDQKQTLSLVNDLITKTSGQMLFDVYIIGSGAAWWQAQAHTPNKQDQMALYVTGENYASKAVALHPEWSSGYLWRAYNLGEYALLEGKMKAFLNGDGKKMETDLKTVMQKKTEDGQPGESDDDFGAARVLGKYYFNVDFIPGNYEKALGLLKEAYDHKLHALNFVFYAQALAVGNCDQKDLAKEILHEVLSMNPNQFDPDSLGELQYNLKLARDLLQSIEMPPNNDIGDMCH